MAKLKPEFIKVIKENLYDIYCYFLKTQIYHSQELVDSLFSDKRVKKEFDQIVELAFSGQRYSTAKYEELTGETNLYYFLFIYKYYIIETYDDMISKKTGELKFDIIPEYVDYLKEITSKVYTAVQSDLQHGNRWWEQNSPTALRRSLTSSIFIIKEKTFQQLAKAYLGREIKLKEELRDLHGKVPVKLLDELDTKMAKHGLTPLYGWYEIVDGQKITRYSDKRPQDGRYCFVEYVKTKDNSISK